MDRRLGAAVVPALAALGLVFSLGSPKAVSPPLAGLSLKDEAGVFTSVPAPARRIGLAQSILMAFAQIDGGLRHVVVVDEVLHDMAQNSPFRRAVPAASIIPQLPEHHAGALDPEAVMRLHPDALFIAANDAGVLRQVGMPGLVAFLPDVGHYIRHQKILLHYAGQVSGKEASAAALLGDYEQAWSRVLATVPKEGRKPRVLIVFADNGALTTPRIHYLYEKVRAAGGEPVLMSGRAGSARYDAERLMLAAPDVILLDGPPNASNLPEPIDFYHNPEMQPLSAVRMRRVYHLPTRAFQNEFVDGPLMLEWLVSVLHPSHPPPPLKDDVRAAYRFAYGYKPSDLELDSALLARENGESAGYPRLVKMASHTKCAEVSRKDC